MARLSWLAAFLLALGTASPARSAPPADAGSSARAGSAADLTGRWVAKDGSRLDVAFEKGLNRVSALLGGAALQALASVSAAQPGRAAPMLFETPSAAVSKGLVSHDRTRLRWKGREFSRQVPSGFVRLSVMTYNMEGKELMNDEAMSDLAHFLDQEKPDIVGLEEVKDKKEDFIVWHDDYDEAQKVASRSGYDWLYGSDRRAGGWGTDEGEALLIRKASGLKFVVHTSLPLPAPGIQGTDAKREVLYAAVQVRAAGQVYVAVTHLSEDARVRAVQTPFILKYLWRPGVVMGDLNGPPTEPGVGVLERRMADAFLTANPGQRALTWPAYAPERTSDYVFVTRDPARARVLASWVIRKPKDLASGTADDHLPEIAVVDFKVR